MNRVIVATVFLALTGTSVMWAASGQAKPGPDPKVGTRVTITGCLHQGTSADSFVLLGVTERPADAPAQMQLVPYAIYWLDSTDGLKVHIGEIVDVTGTVTERRGKMGTITVAVDADDALETEVTIASGGRGIDVTSEKFDDNQPRPRAPAASTVSSSLEVTRPVYKLAVETVRAVSVPVAGPACRWSDSRNVSDVPWQR